MTIHLTAQQHGQRADLFLAKVLPDLTRSAAQKLLEEGRVYREDKPLKKNQRLDIGDQITVVIPDPVPLEAVPQDIPLDVVFEDEDVIVVNKPVGLVVHPAPGEKCQRCWKVLPTVNSDGLCPRGAGVLG